MLPTGVVTLCVVAALCQLSDAKDEGVDVIVQRYKALDYSEISNIKNERYQFQFCACEDDSTSPPSDSGCTCSQTVEAQSVQKSIPHALYSSSCIHTPNQDKCLIGSISSSPKQRYFYVKVSIDSASLTDPPYQKIRESRFKTTERLSCSKEPSCESCTPCKSGSIEITYVVISKARSASNEVDLRRLREPSLPSHPKFDLLLPIKQFKKAFSDAALQKISSLSTVEKIKDYLLAKSVSVRVVPSSFNLRSFRDNLVKQHNIYRKKHDAPPVTYSDQLQVSAQRWAQQLANSASCLKHDPVKRYGESLFFFAAREFPDEATLAEATVQSFYIEASSYDYKRFKPLDYYKTGHFTQLVWKSTKNIGIGVGMRHFNGRRSNNCQPNFESNLLYVVVKYDPPGNVQSAQYYSDNVAPPRY